MGRDPEEAFESVFVDSYAPVLRVAYLLTGSKAAAEDLTQEAFARLYANWRRVSRFDRPGAWVRRVAINLALNDRRKRAPETLPDMAVPPADVHADLHRAILALPRAQRAAVALHYLEDRPVEEVASIMGCATGTAKTHLHRARARLAELLAEEVPDAGR